jgi:uncharacterized RDD family membrane protein YckC
MPITPCPECRNPVSTNAVACPRCGFTRLRQAPAQNGPPLPDRLATRGERLAGFLIDGFLPVVILFGVGGYIDGHTSRGMGGNHDGAMVVWVILFCLAWLAVQIVFLLQSRSLGKAILRMRVVTGDGKPAGFSKIFFLRGMVPAAIFAIPLIGWITALIDLLMIFDSNCQRLVDRLAGTYVVRATR